MVDEKPTNGKKGNSAHESDKKNDKEVKNTEESKKEETKVDNKVQEKTAQPAETGVIATSPSLTDKPPSPLTVTPPPPIGTPSPNSDKSEKENVKIETPPRDEDQIKQENERLRETVPKIVALKGAIKINDEDCLKSKFGYRIIKWKQLATGTRAKFYKANKDGKEQAMKCIALTALVPLKYKDHLNGSVLKIMRYLTTDFHPSVCSIFEIFQCSTNMYVFMELLTGGTLKKYLQKRSLKMFEAQRCARDILEGMCFLWVSGIAHQAIQTSHGVLTADENQVKLVGFGNSVVLWDTQTSTRLKQKKITKDDWQPFMAPEVITEDYDPLSADVWSFGCLVVALLTKKYPFDAKVKDYSQEWQVVCKKHDVTPTKELKDMLDRIFVEPGKRIHLSSLLMQPWLNI